MTEITNIPPHIQRIADDYDAKIKRAEEEVAALRGQANFLEESIKSMKIAKEAYLKYQPYEVRFMQQNTPLSRDLIRNFLKGYFYPVQTVQVIDLLFTNKTDAEKSKLIKVLSVIFNQMAADGEIEIEKKKGVKGNYYKWKRK